MIVQFIPLLLLGFIFWLVWNRSKSRRRSVHGFASRDTIAHPTRQLDAGLSLRFGATGVAGNVPQPLRWVVSGLAVAILLLAALEFVLRYTAPMAGPFMLGYLAMLVLGGVFLPALKLPAYGLGQPRATDGKAPRGSGLLTVVLLLLLTNGAVQRGMRALDFYTFDLRMPGDTADIVFAWLMFLTLIAVILRLLADRSDG